VGVGVLERHQTRQRLVRVGRIAERRIDRGEVQGPVGPVLERPRADTHHDGMAGCLVDDEVVRGAGDDLLASGEVGHHRHEVAHRAGRDEQPGVLAEQVGGPLLEGDDGRVVAKHIVPDLGRGHRSTHGLGGS
jgi:hypothetical protein